MVIKYFEAVQITAFTSQDQRLCWVPGDDVVVVHSVAPLADSSTGLGTLLDRLGREALVLDVLLHIVYRLLGEALLVEVDKHFQELLGTQQNTATFCLSERT